MLLPHIVSLDGYFKIRAKKTSLKQQIWVNLANFCSYQFQKHEKYEKHVELFEIHMFKYLPASFMKYFLDYSFKKLKTVKKGYFTVFFNCFFALF